MTDRPLTSAGSWTGGDVWIRQRSGPNPKQRPPRVTLSPWHRVVALGDDRIKIWCDRGPRYGFLWPSGGIRLEIARPVDLGYGIDRSDLPGVICPACAGSIARTRDDPLPELEVLVDDLDDLADRVARRLIERADQQRGGSR